MENRYVYANIKIPILVKSDETLEPLTDYLTMNFELCPSLPEKPDKEFDYSFIFESLKNTLSGIINENRIDNITESCLETKDLLTVHPDEIHKKKRLNRNMSLKNIMRNKHNFTAKSRGDAHVRIGNMIMDMLEG